MKRFIAQTAFLLLIFAPAAADAGTIMKTAGNAFAPPAFAPFCAREPRLCKTGGGADTVALNQARAAELEQVNRAVNARIRERSDFSTSGRDDDWRLPTAYGDCEDFAILKKHELLKRGWPASALLLTVARYRGEGHTVLTVRTSGGDLVLDNLTNSIRDWSRTPYNYFARQSQADGRRWELIGGTDRVAQARRQPDA